MQKLCECAFYFNYITGDRGHVLWWLDLFLNYSKSPRRSLPRYKAVKLLVPGFAHSATDGYMVLRGICVGTARLSGMCNRLYAVMLSLKR